MSSSDDDKQHDDFDEEEQRPLVSATMEYIHELLREQREEIQELKQQQREIDERQQNEVMEVKGALERQQTRHTDEMQALETQIKEVQATQEEIRGGGGIHNQNKNGFSLFFHTGTSNGAGVGEDGQYALEEDVFTLMMTSKFLDPPRLHTPHYLQGLQQYSHWRMVKRFIQVLCCAGGISMLVYSLYGLLSESYSVVDEIIFLVLGIALAWWVMSGPWFLGMLTFSVFQIGLGVAIIYDQWINTRYECGENKGTEEACLPFDIPFRVGSGVTFAQYVTVILVLATQRDIFSSIQTVLLLRNVDHVPWDKVIGEEGNRTWRLWIIRILLPNTLKFTQSSVILFASFIIIIQSKSIIDLLKDFTAVLIISQADNLMFYIAVMGYLGNDLALKAAEAKAVRWMEEGGGVGGTERTSIEAGGRFSRFLGYVKKRFSLRVCIFGMLCIIMIGGLTFIVTGQYNGKWLRMRYPSCNVYHYYIGNGYCNEEYPYNTKECGFDGGDCIPKPVNGYPNCFVHDPHFVGNGWCDATYNTEECGLDGGDCIPKPVDSYPECFVDFRQFVGDGKCRDHPPYNTEECGFDGGDCIPKAVDSYPECLVHDPNKIGDGWCFDYPPYNTEECGFDGGDCIPKPVDSYPGCLVHDPYKIGNRDCDDKFPYNTEVCGFDGGDCVVNPVDGYPGCFVSVPSKIGNGECEDYFPYNTEVCGFDGGDCL